MLTSLLPEVHTIGLNEPGYPMRLREVLGKRAPERLFLMGNFDLLERPSVGFCGSRKASEKGLETAKDCSNQAAEQGVVVVSGNASGVDVQAHHEALANDGSTILVLPEGIEHFRIRRDLKDVWDWKRALVISQFQPSTPWKTYNAMARNKVILGLSFAMIVIEAGETGGTLDAGRSTLEANMPLFVAQYGDVESSAKGNRILIEAGAIPLNRSRTTMRANMQRVWQSVEKPDDHRRQGRLL